MQAFGRGGHNQIGKCLVKALHTSAWPSSHSCMLPMGHTHTNASANTGPKSAFQGLKGKKKKKKKKRERKVDVLVPDFEFVRKCTFMFGESKNLLGKELK